MSSHRRIWFGIGQGDRIHICVFAESLEMSYTVPRGEMNQ